MSPDGNAEHRHRVQETKLGFNREFCSHIISFPDKLALHNEEADSLRFSFWEKKWSNCYFHRGFATIPDSHVA